MGTLESKGEYDERHQDRRPLPLRQELRLQSLQVRERLRLHRLQVLTDRAALPPVEARPGSREARYIRSPGSLLA
jgi:hypothetical protein